MFLFIFNLFRRNLALKLRQSDQEDQWKLLEHLKKDFSVSLMKRISFDWFLVDEMIINQGE